MWGPASKLACVFVFVCVLFISHLLKIVWWWTWEQELHLLHQSRVALFLFWLIFRNNSACCLHNLTRSFSCHDWENRCREKCTMVTSTSHLRQVQLSSNQCILASVSGILCQCFICQHPLGKTLPCFELKIHALFPWVKDFHFEVLNCPCWVHIKMRSSGWLWWSVSAIPVTPETKVGSWFETNLGNVSARPYLMKQTGCGGKHLWSQLCRQR
jgi:hypothetical protein